MLMKALGYFQYSSDFGGDWQLATTRQGNAIDLFVGVDSGVTQAMTRNDVAQLVLNTLEAGTVQASTDGSWSIGDVVINNNVTYNYITSNQTYARAIDDDRTTNNDGDLVSGSIVELGEQLYMGDLKLDKDTTDVFGRPSRTWSFGGNEIGTYAQKNLMVAEYTTAVTGKDLYDVIGKTAYDNYEFESYVDGAENDLYEEISRNNKDDVSETGNGALTQVFVDSDNKDVIVTVINTYLAKADTDYNEKKEEVSFKLYAPDSLNEKIMDVSAEDFAIEDVVEGDFALVTYSFDSEEIESISDVETMSGVTITRFTSNDKGGNSGTEVSSVTADGTKYDASNTLTYEADTLDNYTNSNLKDKTYNVYLDQYGYAIGVEGVEGSNNYLFLTGINGGKDYLATANFDANAIFLDGTSEVIKVKSNDAIRNAITEAIKDTPDEGRGSQALINTWFKYTVNSSGVYTLTAIDYDLNGGKNDLAQNQTVPVDTDKDGKYDQYNVIDDRHISLLGGTGDGKIYGNEDTVYLVAGLDTVSVDNEGTYGVIADADEVIVGVDNVSIDVWSKATVQSELKLQKSDKVAHSTYALYDDSGVVIAAVVVGESEGSSSNVAYVISEKASEEGYENGEWSWTRDVVIDGKIVTLNEVNDEDESILADEMVQHTWYTVKYDADGNVKSIDKFDEAAKYADDMAEAVTELRDEDLVVMQLKGQAIDYSKNGRTIYNWNGSNQDIDNGIYVDTDVQFVIRQINKNKTITEEYTGWNQLKSALDTLNETRNYDFNAVIENGRITSAVIIDWTGDGYDGPSNESKGVVKVELEDSQYNDAVVPYVLAGNWTEDAAVNAIKQELIDQGYTIVETRDHGSYYTFETLTKHDVKKTFTWDVTYYENVYAVGTVISNFVSNDKNAKASVNAKYLVPGESITFTYDREGNWMDSSYTVNFTVGGQTVSGVTLDIDGTVATATFKVPYNLTDGNITLNA